MATSKRLHRADRLPVAEDSDEVEPSAESVGAVREVGRIDDCDNADSETGDQSHLRQIAGAEQIPGWE